MDRDEMLERVGSGRGFIAAIDQSGGSTPRTLIDYGLAPGAWTGDEEMFELIHRMRCRILAAPCFNAQRILATILYERTMDGEIEGQPVPTYLHAKGIVPFLKVDQGLEAERDGVRLMKPLAGLAPLLERAKRHGMFGTKMRSVILAADRSGIGAAVAQQLDIAERIAGSGLVPILEPEYDIRAADRAEGEVILHAALLEGLSRLPNGCQVILKLSIPVLPNLYEDLMRHSRALRVAALSGGYDRTEACRKLALNRGMIASFSRALLQDLRVTMDADEFGLALERAIDDIYRASAAPAA